MESNLSIFDFDHKSLYAAFDVYPSAKGAATHISHMTETLFEVFHGGMLYVLGASNLPTWQAEEATEIIRLKLEEPNYLARGQLFSTQLSKEIRNHPKLELCHFRDIWGGLGILQAGRRYRTLFEVNGLPSIELPYRYPSLGIRTLNKLKQLEQFCLKESDHILVPSEVIRRHLMDRGIHRQKISLISNGAMYRPEIVPQEKMTNPYLIYFGALQPWQGLDDLLKAFANLRDLEELRLVICASHKRRIAKAYHKLAEKMDIADRIIWHYRLDKAELNGWISQAMLSIAPLKACSRNISQGCSPLKILESMACGTAIVASDLPVVREIVEDNKTARLVRAERPAELARVIRFLLEYPEEREKLARNALETLKQDFQWKRKQSELKNLYLQMLQGNSKELSP
ncbi:MAG: glycosyltransferase [Bacteroidota bacterium]